MITPVEVRQYQNDMAKKIAEQIDQKIAEYSIFNELPYKVFPHNINGWSDKIWNNILMEKYQVNWDVKVVRLPSVQSFYIEFNHE